MTEIKKKTNFNIGKGKKKALPQLQNLPSKLHQTCELMPNKENLKHGKLQIASRLLIYKGIQ